MSDHIFMLIFAEVSYGKRSIGIVIEAKKQWWLKINKKPLRTHALDGATFLYIIKVKYTVDGNDCVKRKGFRFSYTLKKLGKWRYK